MIADLTRWEIKREVKRLRRILGYRCRRKFREEEIGVIAILAEELLKRRKMTGEELTIFLS